MNNMITTNLAGVRVQYNFVNPVIESAFEQYKINNADADIFLAMENRDINDAKNIYPDDPSDAYVEYMELCPRTSDALLEWDRCVFHGTAFIWRGKAYIFSAPSGTGKTTQYILWKILFGDEIRMINGDKPLLDFSREDGKIWVHPSPWLGKEGMGRMESAELGGIIYLHQGNENIMRRASAQEMVLPIFSQFIVSCNTEAQVRNVCRLEEKLLQTVPVWELTNLGDEASAKLCREWLMQEEGIL